jgi:hypothetical protein
MTNREVVKFNGAPVTLSLAHASGKPGTNDRGKFFTYGVEGNRVFFASPMLDQAIQAQKPGKGTKLSICRQGEDDWKVERLDPPAEQPKTCNQAITQPAVMADLARTADRPNTIVIPTQVQYGHAFADFLILAADAVRTAERNSPTGSVRFDNRDVAAIATTMWIAAEREGFLTWNGAAQGGR